MNLEQKLEEILKSYQANFSDKEYTEEMQEDDILMQVYGISQELKAENKQFWGRQLGMCWQKLVVEVLSMNCSDCSPPFKIGLDEPCDVVLGTDAIDTKYRVGSGDSGTLKKFKQYGALLTEKGYRPVLLFVRTDNLPAAIGA